MNKKADNFMGYHHRHQQYQRQHEFLATHFEHFHETNYKFKQNPITKISKPILIKFEQT